MTVYGDYNKNQGGFQGTDEDKSDTVFFFFFFPPATIFEPVSWHSLMHKILTCVLISFAYEANCNASYLPTDIIRESRM